ncbi:MAG: LPS-assembly protein LptD [Cyclobacteriaceae bacterium]|nr:LPS-assembly protein LptD [Cyclobacteriaceae bacterium]
MNNFTLFKPLILSAFLLLFLNIQANSQVSPDSSVLKIPTRIDSIAVFVQDSAKLLSSDSTFLQEMDSALMASLDSIPLLSSDSSLRAKVDSVAKLPPGDIKTTVIYNAEDSITINMFTKNVKIYGSGIIDYNPIQLDAQEITINWEENYMQANGVADSTGKVQGKPLFKNGSEEYQTNEIKYNFKTEKASITGLVTTQGDAFIHADKVFKNANGELFNQTTLYTTCNLEHPHYSIKARKVKIIPNKEMIAGPFNMIINDVPTPLGFAFGMFPDQQSRTSGVIFPDFGEETVRGFYLKNGGYYFAISDYINLDLTGDLYTRGGWAIRAKSTYNVRYKFRGNFGATFSKFKQENEATLEDDISNDFRLVWSHTPVSKGTGRFSANINYATNSYNKNNQLNNQNDQIRATLSSTVNYSKTFAGTPFSMGISGRYNQNLNTKQADLLLPDLTFNVQNIYPFKGKGSSGNKWYEKIVFRYALKATNKATNRLTVPVTTEDIFDDEGNLLLPGEQTSVDSIFDINSETIPFLLSQGSNGVKHNIPLSASFKLLKHFTISPSLNYDEIWYFKKLDYSYNEQIKEVEIDTIKGFNAIRSYSTSASLNTRIYGTVLFDREYGIKAIRHMMTPSISYSYRPDFGDEKFDYYQTVQVDSTGATRQFSRYSGFVYGQGPGVGESSSISLSITNTLEMKYKSRKDTTDQANKIALLRNFGMSTSYNLAAEQFKLSNISIRATADLLKNKELSESIKTTGLSINFNGTIDPYVYQLDSIIDEGGENQKVYQVKLDQFTWANGQGLGQFSKFNIAMNTGFQGSKRGGSKSSSSRNMGQGTDNINTNSAKEEAELNEFIANPDLYVDFNIPWSIRLTYNVNFTRNGFDEGKVTQSLRFNGDISITDKWKLTYQSGYDFENKKFTEARFNVVRDLHCWDMTLSWVPFGRYQSYNFTIKAKSSLLQDLKLSKKRNSTDSFGF